MKLKSIKPRRSLSKSHRKEKVAELDFLNFKKSLAEFLDKEKQVIDTEGEETQKQHLQDFLKDSFYKNNHVSPKRLKGNMEIDCVIRENNKADSSVEVIVEVKTPKNKAEMITISDINKKAFHEAVAYYLWEKLENNNNEVKHIIITDIYRWFVFDAQDFARLFAKNKKLTVFFNKWRSWKTDDSSTAELYRFIKGIVDTKEETLEVAYFDLGTLDKDDEKSLLALFKLVSPKHLLKQGSRNDNNSLNKPFYAELLHIIGLEEVKQGSKKIIQRKSEKNRSNGSLLENAIHQIENKGRIRKVRNPEKYGEKEEEQIFGIALEIVLLWINRILFLKLLEGQLIRYNNSKEFSFLTKDKISDYDDLNYLFFDILAKKTVERKETSLLEKFKHIPYLNSSLFEMSSLEDDIVEVSSLNDSFEIDLYSKTILVDSTTKKRLSGNIKPLGYLIDFLDAYDFSSEGDEEIQKENKSLISASVLGLIFEKINGYKDGSFFTPSFITMYMCRETIRRAVVQKFNEVYKWKCKTLIDLYNKLDNISISDANSIINSLTICDPAVGSGHFLVSALNELIVIKSELGILCDKTGKKLREYDIEIENDELILTDEEGDIFEYKLNKDNETQRIQETLFEEKRTLIENCLFGVDINPNSVNICRLRLWIELLKNSYYTSESNFIELQTLPNIDINIKCGNSLISRYDLDINLGEALNKTNYKVKDYKKAVAEYKETNDKRKKRELWDMLKEIKSEFTQVFQLSLFDDNNLIQAQNQEIYKDAFEWRFEFPEILDEKGKFIGFDVVIGNPPYGLFNKKQNKKIALKADKLVVTKLKEKYPEATGGVINAARIFYSFSFKISSSSAFQSMIIPYGVLTDTNSANLRKHIFMNHSLLNVEAFPERDSSRRRVFEDVKMSTAILLTSSIKRDSIFSIGISYERKLSNNKSIFKTQDLIDLSPELVQIPLTDTKSFALLSKVYKNKNVIKLGEISACLTGEVDMTLGKSALSSNKEDNPLLKGVQIDKFLIKTKQDEISQGIIEFIDVGIFNEIGSTKKIKDSRNRRIALQGLTGVNERNRIKATLIKENIFLANSCNYLLEPREFSLEFLLGMLNSSLLNFIFKKRSTSSNVNGYEVDNLPFIGFDLNTNKKIEDLSKNILQIKKQNSEADTQSLEDEIDKMVFKLYELTPEEIEIVRGSNK